MKFAQCAYRHQRLVVMLLKKSSRLLPDIINDNTSTYLSENGLPKARSVFFYGFDVNSVPDNKMFYCVNTAVARNFRFCVAFTLSFIAFHDRVTDYIAKIQTN